MSMTVYVVVRRSRDVSQDMVEIKGIFSKPEEAQKHREYLFDEYRLSTVIEKFSLLDTIEA